MLTTETVTPQTETLEHAAMRSTALPGSDVPVRVLLAPWGEVECSHGRFVVDDESAALASAAFAEHGTDLPIDYEHQTLGGNYAAPNGQAPAAGWIKAIEPEQGVGLMAHIEWTPRARQMLAQREYRYLSPVAIIRKSDRKLVAIHSAALTNKPAIAGMTPIVNRQEPPSPPADQPETSLTIPYSGADANDEAAPIDGLRTVLHMPDAPVEEVLVAAGRRIVQLDEQARERHVRERIAEAMRAGKLVEAQRAWAEALVAREERLFDEWLRTAPVLVTGGRTVSPSLSDTGEGFRHAAARRARAEFRSSRMLSGLTTEDAYVAAALRDAG